MVMKKINEKMRKVAKPKKLAKKEFVENELSKKMVSQKENKQLFWFFVIIGIIFAIFLIPYLWVESLKSFEHGGVEWMVEDYPEPTGTIYHGIFGALNGENLNYNIFLRNDPRKNDVSAEGTFIDFKYGGIVSMTPEVDKCRGELSRVMLDLAAFLRQGVGVGSLVPGSTNESVAIENNRKFARCDTVSDRTLVVVELGDTSVKQDEENPFCYVISAKDCNDVSSVEKFITKTIEDFTLAKKAIEKEKA